MKKLLDKFFYPRGVAVIGATVKTEKIGSAVVRNLLEGGFKGAIYPVNPKYTEVEGLKCYHTIGALPPEVDLAVIAIPAPAIPDIIAACGQAGIECAVIMSGGFKEYGEEGADLFENVQKTARQYGVRLIGPNSIGLLTPAIGLNATYAHVMPSAGRVAFISQSGALGSAILDWAAEKNLGFSHFVSVGSVADIGFNHLIDYFGTDNRTVCILIYMEHLANARKFMSAARAFARSKPIIVLKAGKTPEGVRAVMTHTGERAGSDAGFEAAFQRAGIIRVQTIQELFDCTQAVAMQPLPAGKRLAIVTNAGGPAVIATDKLYQMGGQLARLSPDTLEMLGQTLYQGIKPGNPIDVLGFGTADQFRAALRGALYDKQVDAVLALLTPQRMTDAEETARSVTAEAKAVYNKPVYAVWMGLHSVRKAREVLETGKMPWYPFPERAIAVFMYMTRYRENLELLHETPPDSPIAFSDIRKADAQHIIQTARAQGRVQLSEEESKALLACYGIPVEDKALHKSTPIHKTLLKSEKDPVFGPLISFGSGGKAAAVWGDLASALPPLNLALAKHLVHNTKIARLLEGYEGLPTVPPDFLPIVLCRFAYLLMDLPDIQSCTINPFVLHAAGGAARQAQIVLEAQPVVLRNPYEHLSILPYPTQWMKTIALRNGVSVLLRPIRPEDEPMEAEMVKTVSKESLYFRFFGYMPGIDHKMLARFTHIDYDREMAIVAQIEEEGRSKIIGVVRIVGDGWREMAEYAILVADAWHGHGLGGILTDYILEIARAQGYKKITATFLKMNGAMRRLFERKGFKIRGGEDESDWAELTL